MILQYQNWLNEKTSGDVFSPQRNQKVIFNINKYPELEKEFFDLITTAYAEIGGHAKINSPKDLAKQDWDFWEGIDIHNTKDFDILMFGQKTRYGIKFSGVGHDGSGDAKRKYLDERGKDLKNLGYYVEVSGKVAQILLNKYNVPVVDNQQEVEKVLGKPVKWIGPNPDDPGSKESGWYERSIGGHTHAKILLGRPKV